MLSLHSCARSRIRIPVCVLLAALSQGGLCINLENKDGRLLRNEREVTLERLQLSADGKVLDLVANGSASQPTGLSFNNTGTNAWGENTVSDQDNLAHREEPCDLDFPFGVQNSNSCDSRSTYGTFSNITRAQCIFAAEQAGAETLSDSFEVPVQWADVHPKGCFVFPCKTDSWCYYANEEGDMPNGPIYGRPVCRRDRYIHGTAVPDTNVNDPSLCPFADYEVIESEENCRKAASCLGDCDDNRFGIGQIHFADKDIHPPGCFLKPSTTSDRACVNWNDPMLSGTLFAPKNPVGTPICVVSQPDHVGILNKADFQAATR